MNNVNLKEKLNELINEEKILIAKHGNKHFANEKEGKNYISENKVELERLSKIQKEIRELKFKLMTPEEQLEYLEEQKKIKEKYSDD